MNNEKIKHIVVFKEKDDEGVNYFKRVKAKNPNDAISLAIEQSVKEGNYKIGVDSIESIIDENDNVYSIHVEE